MPFRDVIELPAARIEIEERTGYLLVVESGTLRTVKEVETYARGLTRAASKSGCDQVIIDARGEVGEAPENVRRAMWEWLESEQNGFEAIAYVLGTEIAVTRVNMTAISRGTSVRAFENVTPARRWLARGPRASTADALHASASQVSHRPPARSVPTKSEVMEPAKPRDSRPSTYHSADERVETVQSGGRGDNKTRGDSNARGDGNVRGGKAHGDKGGSQVA